MGHQLRVSFLLCASLMGCRWIDLAAGNSPTAIAARNQERLGMLTVGMPSSQAEAIMESSGGGLANSIKSPFRVEHAGTADGQRIVIAYYYTHCNADRRVTEDELTPVVFVNDKLIGHGRSAVAMALAIGR